MIAPTWAVTAAHCTIDIPRIIDLNYGAISFTLGIHNQSDISDDQKYYVIEVSIVFVQSLSNIRTRKLSAMPLACSVHCCEKILMWEGAPVNSVRVSSHCDSNNISILMLLTLPSQLGIEPN